MDKANDNITTQEVHAIDKLYNTCYFARHELETLQTEASRKVIPYTETEVPAYLLEVKHENLTLDTDKILKELHEQHPQYSLSQIKLSCAYHLLANIMNCLSDE